MASGSTATITFRIDGDNKTFQLLAKDAEGWRKVLGMAASATSKKSEGL